MEAGPSNKRRRSLRTRRQQEEIIEEGEQDGSQVQEQDQGRSDHDDEQQVEEDDHSEREEPLPRVVVNQEVERLDRNQPAATKDLKLKMPDSEAKKEGIHKYIFKFLKAGPHSISYQRWIGKLAFLKH